MTLRSFIERVQRLLVIASISNALVAAAATVLITPALAAFMGRGHEVIGVTTVFAILAAVLVAWKSRALLSRTRVALWIEEVVPSLDYALVTAANPGAAFAELEKSIRVDAIRSLVHARLFRRSLRSLVFLAAASLIYLMSPATSLGRGPVRAAVSTILPGTIAPIDKLVSLTVRVIPPAYAGGRAVEKRDAASLTALAGSRIVMSGQGSPDGVFVTLDNAPLDVTGGVGGWSVSFNVRKPVTVVRASYGAKSRLVVVEAIPDKPPRVVLSAPMRDRTLRSPRFIGPLRAEATDDFRLTDGYFEYLVVSGSGEAFNGRTITSTPFRFDARTGQMRAELNFTALNVGEGDVVSVRAVVRDNNSFSGPSIGTSDTRTFRVARADEYDSLSIEAAAPPPVDSSAMSQRMLILMTEALVKKRKALTRREFVNASDDIATLEDRIRKRVYDIIYQTDSPEGVADTEEPESEIQAINNPDLKQAYDALWDAVRSLRIAEPEAALPPMRIALKALDRARLAQRLYLRGAAPRIVIDVERVRLSGKEKGSSSVRTRQTMADSLWRALATGFEAAAAIRTTNRALAIEQLSLLRVRAIEHVPGFAAALHEAVELLHANRNAGPAIVRARKALSEAARVKSPPMEWSGG